MLALAIVVADAARARLFTYKREAQDEAAPTLRERADLVSPERRMRPRELWTDARPRANVGVGRHGDPIDDHRDDHLVEVDRRFAATVVARVAQLVDDAACARVALVASPRFLGHLREHTAPLRQRGVTIEEVGRDLTTETVPELRTHLGEFGVLPRTGRWVPEGSSPNPPPSGASPDRAPTHDARLRARGPVLDRKTDKR
ncbi:MAG: host attachment protein [Myxococcales bacterium]|nr:host attachment protein [Myxococcales bacterium]